MLKFPLSIHLLRSCLIVFVILLSFSVAYPQESQADKEIEEAIMNAQNGNCEQAIPVLKKYAEIEGFDDLKNLEIYIYLNLCYLTTENKALDVDKVNALTDSYVAKYVIPKNSNSRSAHEIELLLFAGIINKNIGNNEKVIFYLSLIKSYYEENQLNKDQTFLKSLILLAEGYYNLQKLELAIVEGEIALKVNLDLYGEKNETSMQILDLLYSSYKDKNDLRKSIEYLQKYVDIGKEVLGKRDIKYITSLYNLALDYTDLGNPKEALEIYQNVVELYKDVLGEKHPDYLRALNSLAVGYSNVGKDSLALENSLRVVELRKEILGEKDPRYLYSLNNLASVYSDLGDYHKALDIDLKVVELGKEVLGEKDKSFLISLEDLASIYSKLGEYHKALDINLKVVELGKEIWGEKNPDYLANLNILAGIYSYLGDYQKALEINLKVVEIGKEVFGEKHPNYFTSLSNLAKRYSEIGDYQKALEINLKVVELRKEILGEKHPSYLTSLGNLATIYSQIGDYQKALEIDHKVVELIKDILGEKHPSYLTSLGNLAIVYSQIGDYQKALEINLKVVELRKEILGEKHPDYLSSLNSLALAYSNLGDYLKALEINLKVVEFRKEILGENHPLYFSSMSILGGTYNKLGDYQKALEISLKVVEFCKVVLGEKHPAYIRTIVNLALVYSQLGEYQKALEYFLKATELGKVILGEKNPDYLLSLSNLAFAYSNLGDFQKALEIDLEVTELQKEVLGDHHPTYLVSLRNLASVYKCLGDYNKALVIEKQVVESEKKVLGEFHPDYLISLNNLAVIEFNLSKTSSALSHYLEMLNQTQERVIDYFSMMTEYQREQFWKQNSRFFTLFPKYVEKEAFSYPEGAGNAYNVSLFSKGLLLNTTIDFDKLIAEKGTPEAIAKFEELKLLKFEIQRISEKPITERYLNVDSLENIAQQKETELVKVSKEYGDYTQNLKINWKDVQANLQDNGVAIEFVEYPTITDTVKYAALVLRKGWQYPKMIFLFRKDQIDEFIKQEKDKIYSNGLVGKHIKNLIWSPLEEVVSPGDRVYFSPAGVIHQLAIENLPANDSLTLGDLYEMHRLSSTKELAIHQPEFQNHYAVLYGGLQYYMPEEKMMAESKKFEKRENLYAMRGFSNDTTVRSGWEYLGGTLQEVEQISQLMSKNHYLVTKYTGETGNEESFKSLSGKGTGIIHIATHGFFQSIDESRKNLFVQMRMGDQRETGGAVDPMLRSGLMLSGGNRAWQGEKVPENIEDGVLTAREISRMDLRGTDLVVLSACETGLGDVSSEGVFGLQRSFKQAGVKTLVMSLWQVNDEATRFMMTEFYANLLSGKDKRAAFLDAKRKCKKQFPEPQYWAAFIMLD
jgi:tetratricopeptide (TPR) repeat protein